jgi:hypothetical protein
MLSGHPPDEPGRAAPIYPTRTPWRWIALVTVSVALVVTLTAVLIPSFLELVFIECAFGVAALWPVLSEPRAVSVTGDSLRVRRRLRWQSIAWESITEVVCWPGVEAPARVRILSGQGQTRLSDRNPGLAAVLEAIGRYAPGVARTKGTPLRR